MIIYQTQEDYDKFCQKMAELFGVDYQPSLMCDPIINQSKRNNIGWEFKEGNQFGRLQKGIPKSSEHRKKLSIVNTGKKRSKESSEKKRLAMLGKISPNKDKKLSDEWKDNMSAASKGKPKAESHRDSLGKHLNSLPKLVCPHCGKEGRMAPMKRWHFGNCKSGKDV
jgi:ribosomal protein S27AE